MNTTTRCSCIDFNIIEFLMQEIHIILVKVLDLHMRILSKVNQEILFSF